MSADKVERFREALTMRISQTMFDALVAAVREDERARIVKSVDGLYEVLYTGESLVRRSSVLEAIRNA